MRKILTLAILSAVLTLSVPDMAGAQTAPPAAPVAAKQTFVLVPYEMPGSKDPHAVANTKDLSDDLAAAGLSIAEIAPTEHLNAVAEASKLCADNNAVGLLIPDGRSEQTMKRVPIPFLGVIIHYPTHVEFRLDDIGCDGVLRWSTTTTGNQSPGGLDTAGNLGAAVDAAFRSAVLDAAHQFAVASATQTKVAPPIAAQASKPLIVAATAPPQTYALLTFAQPQMADPRAADITQSLLTHLQQHKLNVVVVPAPIDHLTAIASAPQLCSANGAQAIIVPDIRIEQSSFSGRSHASIHLAQLNCNGSLMGFGAAQSDMGNGFIGNFGAAAVGVSERAMDPAIDQLLASEPSRS